MEIWRIFTLLYHDEGCLFRKDASERVSVKVRQRTEMYSDQTTNYNATGKTRAN